MPSLVDILLEEHSDLPDGPVDPRADGEYTSTLFGNATIKTYANGTNPAWAGITMTYISLPALLGSNGSFLLRRHPDAGNNTAAQLYAPPYLIPCLVNELLAFNFQWIIFDDDETFGSFVIPGITGTANDPKTAGNIAFTRVG